MLCAFTVAIITLICPVHHILLDLMTVEVLGKEYKLGLVTAQAVRDWFLAGGTWFQSRMASNKILGGRSGTGEVFVRGLQFHPSNHRSATATALTKQHIFIPSVLS